MLMIMIEWYTVAEFLNNKLVMAASANRKFLLDLKKCMRTKIISWHFFKVLKNLWTGRTYHSQNIGQLPLGYLRTAFQIKKIYRIINCK
jgi:hypothetical protein